MTAAASPCSAGGTTDTQPPAKPVLSLGPATQTSLVLNWQAGSDNIGIDHYNVYRGTSIQASGQLKVRLRNASLNHTYTGLTCGTDYSLALVAEDAAGNKSDLAEAIWYQFAPSPATPRRHRRRRGGTPTRSRRLHRQPGGRCDDIIDRRRHLGTLNRQRRRCRSTAFIVEPAESRRPLGRRPPTDLSCGTAYTFGIDSFDACRQPFGACGLTVDLCVRIHNRRALQRT